MKTPDPQLRLLAPIPLPLPSASGIESFGDNLLIISDDSPFFFLVDTGGKILRQIPLVQDHFPGGRIPKPVKRDLEALARINSKGKDLFLAFGSGAVSPYRDTCFVLSSQSMEVESLSMKAIYDRFREKTNSTPNFEAAAQFDNFLYLFHRGLDANSFYLKIEIPQFIDWIEENGSLPHFDMTELELPLIDGATPAISGAFTIPGSGRMMLTLSTEFTENPYDDGRIGNSFWTIWDPDKPQKFKLNRMPLDEIKIEGLVITGHNPKNLNGYMVTDDDLGGSLLLPFSCLW